MCVSIRVRDFGEVNAEHSAAKIENEFLFCSSPNSDPKSEKDTEYFVNLIRKLLNNFLTIGRSPKP